MHQVGEDFPQLLYTEANSIKWDSEQEPGVVIWTFDHVLRGLVSFQDNLYALVGDDDGLSQLYVLQDKAFVPMVDPDIAAMCAEPGDTYMDQSWVISWRRGKVTWTERPPGAENTPGKILWVDRRAEKSSGQRKRAAEESSTPSSLDVPLNKALKFCDQVENLWLGMSTGRLFVLPRDKL